MLFWHTARVSFLRSLEDGQLNISTRLRTQCAGPLERFRVRRGVPTCSAWEYGWADFAKRYTATLSTFYKGTSKKHIIRRIRFVTPDVAIVDFDNEIQGVRPMPGGIAVAIDGGSKRITTLT